jgi:hypothetical protein
LGRRKRGWKAASGLSLEALRRLVVAKESLIEKLSRLRATLASKLATVEEELAAAGGGIMSTVGTAVASAGRRLGRPKGKRGPGRPKGSKNKPKAGGKRGRKAGPKGQSELHNAIRAVLESSAEPMKLVDVAAKVKANGYETKSKNFPVILGLRLSEMKDVKRVERGVYTMR